MSPQSRRNVVGAAVLILLLIAVFTAVWLLFPPPGPQVEAVSNAKPPATAPSRVSRVELPHVQAVSALPRPRAINSTIPALSFDAKDGARENFDHLGYFDPMTWVRYNGIDVGHATSVVAIVSCSTAYPGRIIYFHIDNANGPVIAELPIPTTSGFEAIGAPIKDATGVHDIFITCTDGGFNLKGFKFLRPQSATDLMSATSYTAFKGIGEPRPGTVGYTDDGDWLKYDQIDFGKGVSFVAVDLAMGPRHGRVEFHLDQPEGPLIGALTPISTGSWTNFQIQETPINGAAGVHDLYLTFHGGKGLPDLRSIQFSADAK